MVDSTLTWLDPLGAEDDDANSGVGDGAGSRPSASPAATMAALPVVPATMAALLVVPPVTTMGAPPATAPPAPIATHAPRTAATDTRAPRAAATATLAVPAPGPASSPPTAAPTSARPSALSPAPPAAAAPLHPRHATTGQRLPPTPPPPPPALLYPRHATTGQTLPPTPPPAAAPLYPCHATTGQALLSTPPPAAPVYIAPAAGLPDLAFPGNLILQHRILTGPGFELHVHTHWPTEPWTPASAHPYRWFLGHGKKDGWMQGACVNGAQGPKGSPKPQQVPGQPKGTVLCKITALRCYDPSQPPHTFLKRKSGGRPACQDLGHPYSKLDAWYVAYTERPVGALDSEWGSFTCCKRQGEEWDGVQLHYPHNRRLLIIEPRPAVHTPAAAPGAATPAGSAAVALPGAAAKPAKKRSAAAAAVLEVQVEWRGELAATAQPAAQQQPASRRQRQASVVRAPTASAAAKAVAAAAAVASATATLSAEQLPVEEGRGTAHSEGQPVEVVQLALSGDVSMLAMLQDVCGLDPASLMEWLQVPAGGKALQPTSSQPQLTELQALASSVVQQQPTSSSPVLQALPSPVVLHPALLAQQCSAPNTLAGSASQQLQRPPAAQQARLQLQPPADAAAMGSLQPLCTSSSSAARNKQQQPTSLPLALATPSWPASGNSGGSGRASTSGGGSGSSSATASGSTSGRASGSSGSGRDCSPARSVLPWPDASAIKAVMTAGDTPGFEGLLLHLARQPLADVYDFLQGLQDSDQHNRSLLQLLLTPRWLVDEDDYYKDNGKSLWELEAYEEGHEQLHMVQLLCDHLPSNVLLSLMRVPNSKSSGRALHTAARHAAHRPVGHKMLSLLLDHTSMEVLLQPSQGVYLPMTVAARCCDHTAADLFLNKMMDLLAGAGLPASKAQVMCFTRGEIFTRCGGKKVMAEVTRKRGLRPLDADKAHVTCALMAFNEEWRRHQEVMQTSRAAGVARAV